MQVEPHSAHYTRCLLDAAAADDADRARLLVRAGVDPNCYNAAHRTPLHVAVCAGSDAVVDFLLSLDGIKLGPVDCRGSTPLWDAARSRNAGLALRLRNAGAPLPAEIVGEMCAAAAADDTELFELLMKAGIDVSVQVRSHVASPVLLQCFWYKNPLRPCKTQCLCRLSHILKTDTHSLKDSCKTCRTSTAARRCTWRRAAARRTPP